MDSSLGAPVGQEPTIKMNLADCDAKRLAEYAGRIEALIGNEGVNSDPKRLASLDDLVGAVYALMFAQHHGFENRLNKQIEVDVVRNRAAQARSGSLRLGGKWLAGFHFNNAVFRLAAVQHRVLQVLVPSGRKLKLADLYAKADAEYNRWVRETWQHACLDSVRKQVNDLKHDPIGIFALRRVSFNTAVGSVGEILDFMEAWLAHQAKLDCR